MTSSTTLTLVDGVRIVVPDSLNLITPYVLLEQQDWFEDEIKFLRGMLKPGQKVIDIGANYGVYTLSMAHAVGATGCVWAFEPASRAPPGCWPRALPPMDTRKSFSSGAPCPAPLARPSFP